MKNLFEVEVICEDCGNPIDIDATESLNKYDAGIDIIYWHTDNLRLQEVLNDFLTNELAQKLKA